MTVSKQSVLDTSEAHLSLVDREVLHKTLSAKVADQKQLDN